MRGEGKEGCRFFLLSNSWLIQFGVLGEKGRTILWKSVRRVPCSHWCPQLSSAPVSEASSQEQGWLSCVDHSTEVVLPPGRSQPVCPAEDGLGACGSSPGAREGKYHAGNLDSHSSARLHSLCLTLTLTVSSPHVLSFSGEGKKSKCP